MKNLFKLTTLLLLTFFVNTSAQSSTFGNISYKKATNISGKQRMLSQRIAKIYLIQQAGATGTELNKELNSSIQLFARNLTILENNAVKSSAKVKSHIKKEKAQWKLFRSKIESSSKPSVLEILSISNELLKKAHSLVLAIEEESKFNKEISSHNYNDQLKVETVNISGKQRMLSQRLCLYYAACRLFRRDKKNAGELCNEVEKVFNEMNTSLNYLLINDLNTFTIEENIGKILGLFTEIENNKRDFYNNKLPLSRVMDLSNNVTNLYNVITGQYASL